MINLELPKTLTVDGIERPIDADFRNIIKINIALVDEKISNTEKGIILLNRMYGIDEKGNSNYLKFKNKQEAINQALWFIDWGKEYKEEEKKPKLTDWKQDFNMICSAVNKVIKTEVRDFEFLHWWTFLGYLSERGECLYSTVTQIREKLANNEKLDKFDKKVIRENRELIFIKDENSIEFEAELFGSD